MAEIRKGDAVRKTLAGQSIIEFTFAMVVTVLLILGMIAVFHWSGRDLMERAQAHEKILNEPLSCEASACPLRQIRPDFFDAADLETAVASNIFN